MTIYVSELKNVEQEDDWHEGMNCKLMADSESELLEFASSLGFGSEWHNRRIGLPYHYDLTEDMRKVAVLSGAIEIDNHQLYARIGKHLEDFYSDESVNKRKIEREDSKMDNEQCSDIAEGLCAADDSDSIVEMPVKAFDTETELISYQNPVPELICLTQSNAGDVTNKGQIETPWEHDIEGQFRRDFSKKQHHVGHSVSFDLSILAFKYPDLLPYIFQALDDGIIHDTLLREKLLNLTLYGNFDIIEVNGCNIRLLYILADLEKKYLNIDRSDLKKDADAPRMHYAMYKNVPLEKWGEKFITYAIDDAVNTGLIYQCQEMERSRCIETTGYDPFKVEAFRVKVSFALRLLECVGSRMHPAMVLEVTKRFRTEYAQPRLRNPLLAAGLLVDAIPEQPHAKGTLDHTDACKAIDTKEHKKARRDKSCGCPLKMKKAVAEKNPTKPLFRYIWNLAGTNANIKAWPSDGCASELHKAGIHKDVSDGKAFRDDVVLGTSLDAEILSVKNKIEQAMPSLKPKVVLELRDRYDELVALKEAGYKFLLPDDIKLATHEEWSSTYSAHDPLLTIWAERKALRKIITDYLPKMYYKETDEAGVEHEYPAEIIRGSFYPLCLTGRSSSSASKLYPSRNEQNVDPRVRPCTIPRDGNIIISTDYNGMELGTLAQKCVELFGGSVMADNINKGIDNHAYLAAQIAFALDETFRDMLIDQGISTGTRDAVYESFATTKGFKESCGSAIFCENFKAKYRQEESKELDRPVLWSDFFKYYRLLAKPTGLGFPGGLAAATMVAYAKGTYKVELSFELAQKLKDVWLETYPEMDAYLKWIKKQKDPNHAPIEVENDKGEMVKKQFYCYDTPRGMHRARCGFCETANGTGLQAFSAEGALEGLYRVQKAMWLADYEGPLKDISKFLDIVDPVAILKGSFPINFLHDEVLWEAPEDNRVGDKVRAVEKIMVDAMEEITPDVKAGAESVAMRRWYKQAEPIWDENNNLIPWEPEPEKGGV